MFFFELSSTSDLSPELLTEISTRFEKIQDINKPTCEDDSTSVLQMLLHKQSQRWRIFSFLSRPDWEKATIQKLVRSNGIYADSFCLVELTTAEQKKKYDSLIAEIHGEPIGVSPWRVVPAVLKTPLENAIVSFGLKIFKTVDPEGNTSFQLNEEAKCALSGVLVEFRSFLEGVRAQILSVPTEIRCEGEEGKEEKEDGDFPELLLALNEEVKAEQKKLLRIFEDHKHLLCETISLIQDTQASVFKIVDDETLGMNAALVKFVNQIPEMLHNLASPRIFISICGETSTGKTTLMEGIIGSSCLPIDADANTACPVHVIVNNNIVKPKLDIPAPFLHGLNEACNCIKIAMNQLKELKIPLDLPLHVTSREAKLMYELIRDNEADSFQFIESIESSEPQIREYVDKINGIIRLVYSLKLSPRFVRRLEYVHPLEVLLRAKDLLAVLPTITACCPSTRGLPFVGQMSFIDTPGISECGSEGTFMRFTNDIIEKVFQASDRIMILTTPTTRSNKSFQRLRDQARSIGPHKVMIVVNKFEPSIVCVPDHDLPEKLSQYRDDYVREGFKRSSVHFMRAKVLQFVERGRSDITSRGGMEALKVEDVPLLGHDASLLLVDLFGQDWHVRHFHKNSRLRMKLTNEIFDEACKSYSMTSNFPNVMKICILPTSIRTFAEMPRKFLIQEHSMLLGVVADLGVRLSAVLDREDKRNS